VNTHFITIIYDLYYIIYYKVVNLTIYKAFAAGISEK